MSEISREEFEELKERVEELEKQQTSTTTATSGKDGLDRRDKAVLDHIKNNGPVAPRELVQLYRGVTDISQPETAKRRAKRLTKHPRYNELTN